MTLEPRAVSISLACLPEPRATGPTYERLTTPAGRNTSILVTSHLGLRLEIVEEGVAIYYSRVLSFKPYFHYSILVQYIIAKMNKIECN